MSEDQLDRLRSRIERLMEAVRDLKGKGFQWQPVTSSGSKQTYDVRGVAPPEETEDTLAHLFIDVWSMKDFVTRCAEAAGRNKDWVLEEVRHSEALKVAADVAIFEKHGEVNKPWMPQSGLKLGRGSDRMPQRTVQALIFDQDSIVVQAGNQDQIDREVPIVDDEGTVIAYALPTLEAAVAAWEGVLAKLEDN